MTKYVQKVVLISSDQDLNDALIDQFKLVKSLEVKILSSQDDLTDYKKVDLIIFNDLSQNLTFLESLSKIDSRNDEIPIIILSDQLNSTLGGKSDQSEKFLVIEKPFSYRYLEKIMVQQLKKKSMGVIKLDKIKFYPRKKLLVFNKSKAVRLTEKEVDILMFLYVNANHAVSKSQLLNKVWGYKEGVTTHTLETHLYYLRKKLNNDNMISTQKDGYLLSL